MPPFADRLIDAVKRTRTPAMVGIDPQWELLPEAVRSIALDEHGETLVAVASAYRMFCSVVIDQVASLAPVVKFQSAFFEAAGPEGMHVLADLLKQAQDAGLLVVFDGKRGDIGSTATAYAQAFLGKTPVGASTPTAWWADAMTVNPFLGTEGVQPFLEAAKQFNHGIFVLVRTSNPSAGMLQDLEVEGRTLYERIADWVEEWNVSSLGSSRFGPVGAVVGATVPRQIVELRARMPHAILLIPGYGAQGGSAADVAAAFNADGLGAVVNNSRGILYAHRKKEFEAFAWQDSIVAATRSMIADLAAHTPAGSL